METKDITINNALIAGFIGERGNDTETVKNVYVNIPVNGMKEITVELDRMKFHKSWDWLMPVCIKLGMIFVDVDINKTYQNVITEIKNNRCS